MLFLCYLTCTENERRGKKDRMIERRGESEREKVGENWRNPKFPNGNALNRDTGKEKVQFRISKKKIIIERREPRGIIFATHKKRNQLIVNYCLNFGEKPNGIERFWWNAKMQISRIGYLPRCVGPILLKAEIGTIGLHRWPKRQRSSGNGL